MRYEDTELPAEADGCPAEIPEAPQLSLNVSWTNKRQGAAVDSHTQIITADTPGIRLRSALVLWTIASILTWIVFHGLIWVFQILLMKFKSEEIYTPLEALLFRMFMFIIYDAKIILVTVLSWGLLYHFMKSINSTWKTVLFSTSLVYFGVTTYEYITNNTIEKAMISDTAAYLYLSLLVPRLICSNLKPGKIR